MKPFAASFSVDPQLHFAQVRCRGCGLLIAQPQASTEEMDRYYRSAYYQVTWSDEEGLWRQNGDAHAKRTLPLLKRLCRGLLDRPARILEVGCGYGSLVGLLCAAGHRAVGMELSLKACAFGRRKGLDIVAARFPETPFRRGAFDVVIARHVIEHLPDPREFVQEMVALTRPGGAVVIETENARIAQYAWDRLRAHALLRIPPFRSSTDHTFVFRPAHLRSLLEEGGCDHIVSESFTDTPEHETLHWRAYKGFFRTLDRMAGGGELIVAAGRTAHQQAE